MTMTPNSPYQMTVQTADFNPMYFESQAPVERVISRLLRGLAPPPAVSVSSGAITVTLGHSLSPDERARLVRRARNERRQYRDEEAKLLLHLLASAEPNDPTINFELGRTLFHPYPDAKAVPYLQAALAGGDERERVASAAYLAIQSLLQADEPQAVAVLKKAGVGGATHRGLLLDAVEGLREDTYDGVIFPESPGRPIAHLTAARLLDLAGDRPAAIACLAQVLRHPPPDEPIAQMKWNRVAAADKELRTGRRSGTRVVPDTDGGLLLLEMM